MVKHIIIWTLKSELSVEERQLVKKRIKEKLEGLKGQIDGLVDIHVQTELLGSSVGDLLLDSTFTDEAALKAYSVHPAHVAVADGFVRPYTAERRCADYKYEE